MANWQDERNQAPMTTHRDRSDWHDDEPPPSYRYWYTAEDWAVSKYGRDGFLNPDYVWPEYSGLDPVEADWTQAQWDAYEAEHPDRGASQESDR